MKNKLLIPILFLGTILIVSCQSRKQSNPQNRAQQKENLVKANKGLLKLDDERISQYVVRRQWNMQTTETGLWYEIVSKQSSETAQSGQIVHLKYSVELLDGTQCYKSDSLGEKVFMVSQGGVEPGLEEAILMLGKGDKARFIMPPHLAHGLLGDNDRIPRRSTIVYFIEVLDITEK